MNKGTWYAIGAFSCWGLIPLYWKLLHSVSAPQLIGHRIIWSFLTLILILLFLRQIKTFGNSAFSWKVIRIYSVAAILLGVNWLVYIWAVNAGHIVETSLGYFINPLLSVILGVVFFREKLRPWQLIPVFIAGAGVLFITVAFGVLPWIALILASTFALYGAIKKIAPLNSLNGLTIETSILLVPAIFYLVFSENAGTGAFLHSNLLINTLILGSGLITTIPLLMFASAAKQIPLSIIGILQYIAPTIQFLIGIIIYHEAFSFKQFIGYGLVWIALILFGVESIIAFKAKSATVI